MTEKIVEPGSLNVDSYGFVEMYQKGDVDLEITGCIEVNNRPAELSELMEQVGRTFFLSSISIAGGNTVVRFLAKNETQLFHIGKNFPKPSLLHRIKLFFKRKEKTN